MLFANLYLGSIVRVESRANVKHYDCPREGRRVPRHSCRSTFFVLIGP